MRTKLPALALCCALAAAAVAGSPDLRTPPLGAASLATNNIMTWGGYTLGATGGAYAGHIRLAVPDPTEELTVCSWVAIRDADGGELGGYGSRRGGNALPGLYYCPRVTRAAPDLLGGAWGWGAAPVAVSGTRAFAYAFPAPSASAAASAFPRGAYTVAWTNLSATMTLTAGGADMTLEAPAGTRNIKPAEADGFILTGSGTGSVGISRMPIHQFFSTGAAHGETAKIISDRLVGTNWCFVAHRVRLTSATHTNALRIVQQDGTAYTAGAACDLPPDGAAALEPGGLYQLVYTAIGDMVATYVYEWDRRVFPKWLSDDDLAAIYEDGLRTRLSFGYDPAVYTNAVYQVDP